MTLRLWYHPFSSYCQKVLVALYERDVPFERRILADLGDPEERAALEALWPMGKIPVLEDEASGAVVAESSAIIEYLDRARPGPPMIPPDPEAALRARVWDRFFDSFVQTPMQAVVGEALRPPGAPRDPWGVEQSKGQLARAWRALEAQLERSDGDWAAGDSFTIADCAAAPALFYANMVQPFAGHAAIERYFERLLDRPSFARAVEEAEPYRPFFPLGWPEGYPDG